MKANDIKKMALNDATTMVAHLDFKDEVKQKALRLSGYEEAFLKSFDKVTQATEASHAKRMNDLVKNLDKIESKIQSHTWGKVTLVSCAIVGVYVFSKTEKGQAVKNRIKRAFGRARENAVESTVRRVNEFLYESDKKTTVEGETSS